MTRRIAIIDLGTNTFHLLIVDIEGGKYHFVYRERNAVKLGMEGINVDMITPDAEERALSTIKGFKQTIDSMAIDEVLAYYSGYYAKVEVFESEEEREEVYSRF